MKKMSTNENMRLVKMFLHTGIKICLLIITPYMLVTYYLIVNYFLSDETIFCSFILNRLEIVVLIIINWKVVMVDE